MRVDPHEAAHVRAGDPVRVATHGCQDPQGSFGSADPAREARLCRAPAVMASAARAASTAPTTSNTMPTQSAASSSAPMLSSDATPRDPSEFMTTALQLPSSASHSSVCSPAPLVDATQKSWAPGGESGAPPGRSEYSGPPRCPSRRSARRRSGTPRRRHPGRCLTKPSRSLSLRIAAASTSRWRATGAHPSTWGFLSRLGS